MSSHGPIFQLGTLQGTTCTINILGLICPPDVLISPAFFCMSMEATCGFAVSSVKIMADKPWDPSLPLALLCSTGKVMGMTPINVSHFNFGSEERIDGRAPVILEAL